MTRLAIWALTALFVINLYGVLAVGWGENTSVSMAFHLLGGFFVAMLVCSFYNSEFKRLSQPFLPFLIAAALTLSIGVVWEFAEYVGYKTLTQPIYDNFKYRFYFMGDLDDTIQDLAMDLIGGLVFLTLYLPKRLNTKQ